MVGQILAFFFLSSWWFPSERYTIPQWQPAPLASSRRPINKQLRAKSYLLTDYQSGEWLVAKHPHQKLLPASLTKLVTALVARQYFPLDEELEVSHPYLVGQVAHLTAGHVFRVRDLLKAMLIHSANDAAFVFADNYHRQTGKNFVALMNTWLGKHGLAETHFANFDGEEDKGHYSTAADLVKIGHFFLADKFLAALVRQKTTTFFDNEGQSYTLTSTDELLGVPGFEGVKTGWTKKAGECFLGYYTLPKQPALMSVVLHSPARFTETERLVAWRRYFTWTQPVPENRD